MSPCGLVCFVVVLLSFLFYFFKHPNQQQSQDRTRKKQRREEAKNSALGFTRTALRFENQQVNPPLRWRGGKKIMFELLKTFPALFAEFDFKPQIFRSP